MDCLSSTKKDPIIAVLLLAQSSSLQIAFHVLRYLWAVAGSLESNCLARIACWVVGL
jgi:hypothetical protein